MYQLANTPDHRIAQYTFGKSISQFGMTVFSCNKAREGGGALIAPQLFHCKCAVLCRVSTPFLCVVCLSSPCFLSV